MREKKCVGRGNGGGSVLVMSGAVARSLVLATAMKLLLVPCYKSTDFEVHRNWLAVTGTLPLSRWYTEATSQWTLDYPPLFGWFECGLAFFAPLADPGILTLQAEPYDTPRTVLFQRCSVMLSDVLLVIGVLWQTSGAFVDSGEGTNSECSSRVSGGNALGVTPRGLALMLVVFSPGLLMVDHVHFQYNGMMLGLQLCALALVGHGRPVLGAALFSILLHMKHIFVYAAPAMAAHLLTYHVLEEYLVAAAARGGKEGEGRAAAAAAAAEGAKKAMGKCVSFVVVAAATTAVSFGPVARAGQLSNMFARLFPFGRGLSHAYWAPNFWALYNALDKTAVVVGKKIGLKISAPEGYLVGGMVRTYGIERA